MGSPVVVTDPNNQPQFVEEPAWYLFTVSLTADQAVIGASVNIDRDADFTLTGIHGSSDGLFTVNMRLPSGRNISNAQILSTDFLGTANQPTAMGPPPIYRAGSVGPQLDLTDVSGDNNVLFIVFTGIRRIKTS